MLCLSTPQGAGLDFFLQIINLKFAAKNPIPDINSSTRIFGVYNPTFLVSSLVLKPLNYLDLYL